METKDRLNSALSVMQEMLCGSYTDEVLFQALQLLQKIFQNIVKNPQEEKFRSIKKNNATLQNKLFAVSEVERLLDYVGFTRIEDALVFIESDVSILDTCATMLGNQITSIRDRHLTSADKEDLKKRQFLEERRIQFEADQARKAAEQKKLKDLMDLDKKELEKREKAKESKAEKREFGSKTKTCADIGIGKQAPDQVRG